MDEFALFSFSFRWQDVVDILLNSYLLFRFYVIFRGTIVLRGLIGIAFLWFFQRLAVYLGMILTSWAIQGITAVAALIIIVVFRNEIRAVIQTKDFKSILWGFSPKPMGKTPVDLIVEAVFEMSQKYVGALIVIPGEHDIKEHIQNGIPWQGKLSREMLLSIFFRDNPVHDGAAIIHGDRITDVGVILPLSQRKDIPSYYGTRHRAALGMAENSDALTIVVSEESGRMITAKGHKITPVHRKGLLENIIREHLKMAPKEPVKYPSRERFEIGLAAVISLLFVVGVWLSFSKGLYTLVTVEVPIQYMNRKPAMEIFDTSVTSAQLHLSGSGALLKSLRSEQLSVRIDLSNVRPGENTFNITQDNISLPPGISLMKVEPAVVNVTLDVAITKQVPIQADWNGVLSPHLLLTEVKIVPETVQVIGPRTTMNETSTIYTEKISMDNITKSGTVWAPLVFDPSTYIKPAPQAKTLVVVEFEVKERSQ
ncbi:MAG: diadenylate cyclase [Desulfobacterales bacterium]